MQARFEQTNTIQYSSFLATQYQEKKNLGNIVKVCRVLEEK